jgi:two-component system, NarL family, nitrate/nitrite response regulator NarL
MWQSGLDRRLRRDLDLQVLLAQGNGQRVSQHARGDRHHDTARPGSAHALIGYRFGRCGITKLDEWGNFLVTRVLIVEDHELLSQSLRFALQADGFDVHEATALDAEAILKAAADTDPDVVLLDLDIGGSIGMSLSLIGPLQDGGAHVVMLTGITDRVRIAECIEAGAIGIISKSEPFERLVDAVTEAVELGTLLTPGQRDALMAELRQQRADERKRLEAFERLSQREAQVLGALMDGRSAEQIAADWVVSVATVRSQIRAVLMKLGVNSQLGAVALARKAGWQPPAG